MLRSGVSFARLTPTGQGIAGIASRAAAGDGAFVVRDVGVHDDAMRKVLKWIYGKLSRFPLVARLREAWRKHVEFYPVR